MLRIALIGGTGIGQQLATLGGEPIIVPTPAGPLRATSVMNDETEIFLVQRHSAGHKNPPHKINYTAIALGLKKLKVKACFSTAAVGSVREDWKAGTMAVCSDFLDFSCRRLTLYHHNVTHTDFTQPFDQQVRFALLDSAAKLGLHVKDGCVYATMDGPRYETPAEIHMLRTLGADVVGMTASSEATLFREAEIPYACLAIVTNLAAGMESPKLTHEEVVEVMHKSSKTAVQLLLSATKQITQN